MALGVNISDLPGYAALVGSELIEIQQSGTNKQIPISAIAAFFGGGNTLASVLVGGNQTLGTNILISGGDSIELGDTSNGYLFYDNVSGIVTLNNTTSGDYIYLGDAFGTIIKASNGAIYADGIGNTVGLNWNESANQIQAFNPNGFWGLTTTEFQIFHDTKVRFDAPLYNFYQLTASRVPYLDASSNLVVSSVTPTELGYLSGVTSAIQTQLNALQTGMFWKAACRVATTIAGTLATDFENGDTIDGVVLATGDRILIKDQASSVDNGIYIVNASGAPTRATDFDAGADNLSGATITIQEGTANAEKKFTCSTNDPITIGVTNITFIDAGGLAMLGTTNRISVTGNVIDIDASYVGQASITTLGTIGTGVWQGTAVGPTYGGTGLTSVTANRILYATGTNTWGTSTKLNFNGTGLQVGDGTMFGTVPMEMSRTSLGSDFYIRNNLASASSALFLIDGIGLSNALRFQLHGSTFASSGITQANTGALFTQGTNIHLNIGTFGASNMTFWTSNTQRGSIDSSGFINLGTYGSPSAQRLVTIGDTSTWVSIGSQVGTATNTAFYFNQTTPSATNYTLFANATQTVMNGSSSMNFRIGDTNRITLTSSGQSITPGQGVAGTSIFQLTTGNNSNQTAGANVPKMLFTIGTTSWATGALAAADFVKYTQPSVLFTAASTATLAATFAIDGAPIASTNASITTSVGLLVKAGSSVAAGTTTAYGAYFNAPSGATNNYALGVNGVSDFLGNVRLTQTVTSEVLISDTSVTIVINGTTYKLLAKA